MSTPIEREERPLGSVGDAQPCCDRARASRGHDGRARALRALVAALTLLGLVALVALVAQCRSSEPKASARSSSSPWEVVYEVLQHPRCLNCHPAGDAPLQGDQSLPHAQNVQRGPDGHGLFAMRCATCHGTENRPGAHLPPVAPNWHLPHAKMPLVFEGLSSEELCRQLADPARNGGKTPEQLFEHVAADPLVLWGWSPGDGRAPVSIPHAEVVAAMRAWVDGGCDCP